jgi:hypothetical protein
MTGLSTDAGDFSGALVCDETTPITVALATAVPTTMLATTPMMLLPT